MSILMARFLEAQDEAKALGDETHFEGQPPLPAENREFVSLLHQFDDPMQRSALTDAFHVGFTGAHLRCLLAEARIAA